MAVATFETLDTLNGIVEGRICPSTMPFADLSAGEQRNIIADIESAMEAIESLVTDRYPDLDDPVQRMARIREYKREYLSRVEDKAAASSYFDTLHGVLIRDAMAARTYSVLEDGSVDKFAAA